MFLTIYMNERAEIKRLLKILKIIIDFFPQKILLAHLFATHCRKNANKMTNNKYQMLEILIEKKKKILNSVRPVLTTISEQWPHVNNGQPDPQISQRNTSFIGGTSE